MNGAQLLITELEALGVEVIFGYPGGAIMPVYDALTESTIRHILVRHEQAAALAAGGYARATGRVGVCMATSGPGATNLVTGIADAFMDSVPLVAITGQVATTVLGTDAFQEVDTFGITLPIVKHSYLVKRSEDLLPAIRGAFSVAISGRPGPVLIDLPKDIAFALSGANVRSELRREPPSDPLTPSAEDLQHAAMMIARSRRPLIYAGGGLVRSRTCELFREFVGKSAIPTVTSLNGIGTLPTGHHWLLGMLGMHGSKTANRAVQDADLLICMGARFDDRATGKLNSFAPMASVIHMDIDPAELGKLRRPSLALTGDLEFTLARLSIRPPSCDAWRKRCLLEREQSAWRYDARGQGIYTPALIREISARDPGRWTITCDVGQHQMWVAQHAHFTRPEQHISSGGLGTMGFGIPAAIGARLALPDAHILAISGDGSFMMNVQELATIHRYDLDIKIVVIDNSGLGLVRQWQECFFDRRFCEVDLSDNPDFALVAEAFGIPAMHIERADQISAAIDWLESMDGPGLLHVRIDAADHVWPLVPPNQSNSVMIDKVPCSISSK